jgi:bifunctional non-homologous end joining protein LigD
VPTKYEFVDSGGEEIRVSNPDKLFFPDHKLTKLDLVLYYRDVGEGALVGLRDRPSTLYRWPNGVTDPEPFYQKRVPRSRPEWLQTTTVHFPSGRSAEMLVVADVAHLLWEINLGCIDMNPWPVRKNDVDHPDELRIDLDPTLASRTQTCAASHRWLRRFLRNTGCLVSQRRRVSAGCTFT